MCSQYFYCSAIKIKKFQTQIICLSLYNFSRLALTSADVICWCHKLLIMNLILLNKYRLGLENKNKFRTCQLDSATLFCIQILHFCYPFWCVSLNNIETVLKNIYTFEIFILYKQFSR